MEKIKKLIITFFFIFSFGLKADSMVNPITDLCWECFFPIIIGGVNVTPNSKDFEFSKSPVCVCSGVPPKVGLPISFWEPMHLVDVTRHAYKMIGLGGIKLGKESIKNRGTVGLIDGTQTSNAFFHVHYYSFPVMKLMGIFSDFACVDKRPFDVSYMSELDPTWDDDALAIVLNPEAVLFSQPMAQMACMQDCITSSLNKPHNKLFWCAGCEGSLYPFTGNIAHYEGPAQASSLLLQRALAKLHRTGVLKGYKKSDFCEAHYMPIMRKTLYKTQLAKPKPQRSGSCQALGKSDILWGSGKALPGKGEDFCFVLWSKKQCCIDGAKVASFKGVQ